MKRLKYLCPVLMIVTTVIISCSKKADNSFTAERRKYAWVVGFMDSTGYGMIQYSADCGETWARQGQGSLALEGIDVSDIWAIDENTVWAVCSDNVIVKTTDGGKTWARITAPASHSKPRLSAISIANKTNIWISGSGGTVYKSADGGVNWTTFDTNFFHRSLMQGIWAVSPQKVYVVGKKAVNTPGGFIGFTIDGGATWDSLVPENNFNKHEWIGVTSSGNTIVVYGGNSFFMVSIDGGATWKNDSVHTNGGGGVGADINHLVMLDPQTWWGAFDMNSVYLTTDGGKTWTPQLTDQGNEFLMGIDAWDSQNALAVGESAGWPNKGPVLKFITGSGNWITKKSLRSNLSKASFIKQ